MEPNWTKTRIAVSNVLSFGVLACLILGTGYYLYETRPCAQPIYYDIGSFSPQFGISQSDFLADAKEAAGLWNAEAGKTLLAYKQGGSLPINLIYDSRQELADAGAEISAQEAAVNSQKAQVSTLNAEYTAAKQQLLSDESAGENVNQLNAEIESLNALGAQLQNKTNALNAQIAEVNASANSYNASAGTDFDEGEYVKQYGSTYINIYEFTNNTQLVRILAHEMGHSLGLAHNPDPASIMYPENKATTIALSLEDKAELTARCALTWQNLNPFYNPPISSI
jgi:predicted Zn-dependent protease